MCRDRDAAAGKAGGMGGGKSGDVMGLGIEGAGEIIHSNLRPEDAASDRGPSRIACTSALPLRACDATCWLMTGLSPAMRMGPPGRTDAQR